MFSYEIQPPSHWLYHLANIFLLLSYLSPHLLILRTLLAAGCLCFALWGLLVLAISIDTVVYNVFFFIINAAHAVYLIYQMKPVVLDSELEMVWRALFDGKDGLLMSRRDWKQLTEKDIVIRGMQADERFATRQTDRRTDSTVQPRRVGRARLLTEPLQVCVCAMRSWAGEHSAVAAAIRSHGCLSVSRETDTDDHSPDTHQRSTTLIQQRPALCVCSECRVMVMSCSCTSCTQWSL